MRPSKMTRKGMMSITYHLNGEHAKKYGVNEAIFLSNLQFWIIKNRANRKNQFEERTWTYNSYKAFSELFPFFTARQIRYVVQNLIELEVIITRQEKGAKQNDGLYYAFKNESDFLPEIKKETEESDVGVTKLSGGVTKLSDHSIYTYNKPYKKKDFKSKNKKEAVVGISYACDQTEHCSYNDQNKQFGEQGYFCMCPGIEYVKTQTENGQIYNLLMCKNHEKIAKEQKSFKYDKFMVSVLEI